MTHNFVGGLVKRAKMEPSSIWVIDRNPPKNQALQQEFGVQIANSINDLISQCDTVVISVKPQGLKDMVLDIADELQAHKPLILSLAAGITLSSLQNYISRDAAIIRMMPNLSSRIGLGASGLLANSNATEQQRELAQTISDSVGVSAWVNSDEDIDSITALSGSGPAYFMLFIQSLAQAAKDVGIPAEDAKRFATQTALGAAKLIETSDDSIETLIAGICSKGGTTEQAINQLHDDQLPAIVQRAFSAAKQRSEELAQNFS